MPENVFFSDPDSPYRVFNLYAELTLIDTFTSTQESINDTLQWDKEIRQLRKIDRERLKNMRKRLAEIDNPSRLPDVSVEELEEIRRKTIEKQEAENNRFFKARFFTEWLYGSFFQIGCCILFAAG